MGKGKRAWIYCSIDAPEDTHGALKEQFKSLMDYAEQMCFETVGSSSDMGLEPLWERDGFLHFIEAAKKGGVDALLIVNQNCLSRSSLQLAQLQALASGYGLEIYSPAEGRYNLSMF